MVDHDKLTDRQKELFYEPGYVPTWDDVLAVVKEQGQWGSLPKYIPCPNCDYPTYPDDKGYAECPACNHSFMVE